MIFVCVLAVSCAVPLVAFADDEETECSHGWVQTSYPENTCESYTIDYTCSICGETYSEIYEGNGHTYVAVESYVHCTTEGYITYECSVCGDTYTETVDPVGHSYDILSGYTIIDDVIYAYYTCSYCGESVTSVVISDLYIYCDHANLEFLGAYDSLGLVVYYCSDCDCDIWYHTHYYTIIDVDYDSCTSQFYAMYECDFCGDTYTEYGDSNHYYVSISYSGVISYLCLICGDFYTDYELGEGFIIFDDYVAVNYCLVCGDYDFYLTSSAAPTCTEFGLDTYTCETYNYSVSLATAPTGHSYSVTSEDSTTITYTCDTCGDTYSVSSLTGEIITSDSQTILEVITATFSTVLSMVSTIASFFLSYPLLLFAFAVALIPIIVCIFKRFR